MDKALRLLDLYSRKGVDPKRVYIKIASTWEGIEACRRLQKQGIDTNMTLLFSFAQVGVTAAAVGITGRETREQVWIGDGVCVGGGPRCSHPG